LHQKSLFFGKSTHFGSFGIIAVGGPYLLLV